jgi:hypothetical protein
MSSAVLAVLENFRAPRTWKRWEMLPKMAAGSHLLAFHRMLRGRILTSVRTAWKRSWSIPCMKNHWMTLRQLKIPELGWLDRPADQCYFLSGFLSLPHLPSAMTLLDILHRPVQQAQCSAWTGFPRATVAKDPAHFQPGPT